MSGTRLRDRGLHIGGNKSLSKKSCRSDMWREMESLGERLDEAAGVTSAQAQLNKKRELEVVIGWLLCVFLQ